MPGDAVMTSRRALPLILIIGLASLLASSAGAATKAKSAKHHAASAGASTASTASSCRGGNLFPCGPVYNGTDYLGSDPDPFIRLMIQRDLGAKYGGES
jgi:hypothetical protein